MNSEFTEIFLIVLRNEKRLWLPKMIFIFVWASYFETNDSLKKITFSFSILRSIFCVSKIFFFFIGSSFLFPLCFHYLHYSTQERRDYTQIMFPACFSYYQIWSVLVFKIIKKRMKVGTVCFRCARIHLLFMFYVLDFLLNVNFSKIWCKIIEFLVQS